MEKHKKIILFGIFVFIFGLFSIPSLIGNLYFQSHDEYCSYLMPGDPVECTSKNPSVVLFIGVKTYIISWVIFLGCIAIIYGFKEIYHQKQQEKNK